MADLKRNIELKARDSDPGQSRRICRDLGAEDHGDLWQRDTYFHVPGGRLKLREQRPGSAHLIQYSREDRPEQRESRYRVAAVMEPTEMAAVLGASLGVRVVVEKRRRLFVWNDVRIHLDDVRGLGCFLELEAVAPPDSDLSGERRAIAELRDIFAISDSRLIATGYADQLEHRGAEHQR
jgi:adenylate cyclase class 2